MNADAKKDGNETVKTEDDKNEPVVSGSLPRATDPFSVKESGRDKDEPASEPENPPHRGKRARARTEGRSGDAAADAIAAIARRHRLTAEEPEELEEPAVEDKPARTARPSRPAVHPNGAPVAMYDRFVETEDDLIGLIAYALYKQHKQDWSRAFEAENGRGPREEEINSFLVGERTANRLRGYREQAASVLASYADSVVADARPQILVEAIEGKISSSLRWWKLIPAGFAGAVLFVLLIAIVVYGLPYIGVNTGLTTGPVIQ